MKNIYKKGDIILIRFPFTNVTDFKVRPALVIRDQNDEDLTVLPISTTVNMKRQDIAIKKSHYATSPLSIPSVVRLRKITTLHGALVVKKISEVNREFLGEVLSALFRYLG